MSLLTNGVTWYLRSSILVSDERVHVDTPRTFLGFLPIGRKRLDAHLGVVEGCSLGPHLYPVRLAVAVGLLATVIVLDWGLLRAIVLAAAIGMLLLSLVAVIRIDQADGERFVVPVCLAHLGRASRVVSAINLRKGSRQSEEMRT